MKYIPTIGYLIIIVFLADAVNTLKQKNIDLFDEYNKVEYKAGLLQQIYNSDKFPCKEVK